MCDPTWTSWILADSALPTGGFVSSAGLESFYQSGLINSLTDLNNFITFTLDNYIHSSMPFIEKAFHILLDNNKNVLERLVEIDTEFNAMQSANHVSKRASEAQGIAYLSLMCKSFHDNKYIPLIKQFKQKVRSKETHGHHAICFGITCAAMGLSIEMTKRISLYTLIKNILSAAVRLNIIGPYQ